ncbi:MAG: TetR/AcrR family transcriptional regulator, partial [Solirubrobacteraceae bacterium]
AKMREDRSLLGGLSLDPTVLTGVLAGAWQLARRRLLEDRVAELHDLRCELLGWVATYSSPAVKRLRLHVPGQTQGQPPTLSIGGEDPNRRILMATVQLVARDGYRDLSPAAIIDAAGVSYEDFFERHQTVEQCFLAAIELIAAESLAYVWSRARAANDWIGATRLAIDAFLSHMAAEPTFAPIAFVEVFALDEPAMALRERLLRSVEQLYIRHVDGPNPSPSALTAEAVVGALWGLVYDKAVRGESHRLPELSEYAAYIALAPVLGAGQAVERIVADRHMSDSDSDDSVKQ